MKKKQTTHICFCNSNDLPSLPKGMAEKLKSLSPEELEQLFEKMLQKQKKSK